MALYGWRRQEEGLDLVCNHRTTSAVHMNPFNRQQEPVLLGDLVETLPEHPMTQDGPPQEPEALERPAGPVLS